MKSIICALLFIPLSAALALDPATSKMQVSSEETATVKGLKPFVGLDLGYTNYSDKADVEGIPSSVKVLGSYYLDLAPVVLDAGLGFNQQKFSQSAVTDRNVSGTSLELAARYEFAHNWQVGGVENTLFNQGPSYTAKQADVQLVGFQVLKQFPVNKSWLARVGARVMTGINTDTRINMALIDLQLGWNPNGETHSQVQEAQINLPARPVVQAAPASALQSILARERMTAKNFLHFAPNQAKISKLDNQRLATLAHKLKGSALFSSIEVVGHTDKTGLEKKNLPLSQKRSEAVAAALKKAGLPVAQLQAKGVGSVQPLIETNVKAQMFVNRRVELRFNDVKDEAALSAILKSVR